MTDTPRSWKRPVEEVARAMHDADNHKWPARYRAAWDEARPEYQQEVRDEARLVLDKLTALGFLTIECLEAIKAEEQSK